MYNEYTHKFRYHFKSQGVLADQAHKPTPPQQIAFWHPDFRGLLSSALIICFCTISQDKVETIYPSLSNIHWNANVLFWSNFIMDCARNCHFVNIRCHQWHLQISSKWPLPVQPVTKSQHSRGRVTKAPFVNFSVSKIFEHAKTPLRFFESHSYLSGVTAAELRRHL